jgi:hypothetical protein
VMAVCFRGVLLKKDSTRFFVAKERTSSSAASPDAN